MTLPASAGWGSTEHAEEMTAAYIADTERPRPGQARPRATRLRDGYRDRRPDRGSDRSRHAYEAAGDIYFSVGKFDGYGKLSNRDPRIWTREKRRRRRPLKRDPLDFALWKAPSRARTLLGLTLGRGSARLAHRVLGDGRGAARRSTSTIHGGGSDLVFPHHENEIAQTEAARG